MKHWRIDLTVRDISGKCMETFKIIEALNISEAVDTAMRDIAEPLKAIPEITDVVIWSIGVMEDDVFAE